MQTQLLVGRFFATTLLLFGLTSCLNEFSLEPTDDTNPDSDSELDSEIDSASGTNTDTEIHSDSELDSETGTAPRTCPSGVEFSLSVEYTEIAVGHKTGPEYVDACPAGQVLIGFDGFLRPEGKDDEAHARIRGICGTPNIHLVGDACEIQIAADTHLPYRGTEGEIEWSQICPENKMIIGYKAWTGYNIYNFVFRCAPLVISGDADGHSITRGPYSDLPDIGTIDGPFEYETDCPEGQVATTTKINADIYPRSFGLGCQTPSLVD